MRNYTQDLNPQEMTEVLTSDIYVELTAWTNPTCDPMNTTINDVQNELHRY